MKKISIKRIISWINFNKLKFLISVIALSAAASGGYLFAYAQQFIDSFLDTSRVANTWNVEVDTADGEVKLAQRSCDNAVWHCDLTWRCSGLMGDGNGLLVKRTGETTTKQWKIWNDACNTPECGIDGGQGDNIVVDNTLDFSAYYPARQACKDVGGRLPTINELQCIYSYKGTYGFTLSATYWSSTERDSSYAYYLTYGTTSYGTKSNAYNVLCVRGW